MDKLQYLYGIMTYLLFQKIFWPEWKIRPLPLCWRPLKKKVPSYLYCIGTGTALRKFLPGILLLGTEPLRRRVADPVNLWPDLDLENQNEKKIQIPLACAQFCLFLSIFCTETGRAISGPKTGSTFNRTLPMPRVMSIPRIKIIKPRAI